MLPRSNSFFSTSIALPWFGGNAPHATLDVLRGCNIACPSCYNARPTATKGLDQLRRELDQLLALRRLQTITLSGGEPLLHPDLPDIIRLIHRRNLCVAILTNGLLLDASWAKALRQAGADAVLLHIQQNQSRADAPPPSDPDGWRKLRASKARLVTESRMAAGLALIASPNALPEFMETVEEMLTSPHLEFMLITTQTDFARFLRVRGDIHGGLRADAGPGPYCPLSSATVRSELERKGMSPFAHVGSFFNPDRPRWLTYLSATLCGPRGVRRRSVAAARSDRFFVELMRRLNGRYSFLYRAGAVRFRLQLLFNALSGGGRLAEALSFIAASLVPGRTLVEKHIVFQEGPAWLSDGTIDFCRDCPDATIRNGHLVPLCLADRMEESP
jgi:hypothetical protein